MTPTIRITTLLLLASLVSGTTLAQSGGQGIFNIYNDTTNNIVIGFYTNDGSGWSDNWLDSDLDPGEAASAQFHAARGSCDQTFQVGWLGEGGSEVFDEPISIDICEASNVYLEDNEIYFD